MCIRDRHCTYAFGPRAGGLSARWHRVVANDPSCFTGARPRARACGFRPGEFEVPTRTGLVLLIDQRHGVSKHCASAFGLRAGGLSTRWHRFVAPDPSCFTGACPRAWGVRSGEFEVPTRTVLVLLIDQRHGVSKHCL